MHNIAKGHKLHPCVPHGVLCTTTEIKEKIIMSEKEKALTRKSGLTADMIA